MWALGIALAGSQRGLWCAAALALFATNGCTQSLGAPDSTFAKPLSLQASGYLQPERPQPFAEFGWSLALSGDTVAVGAPFEFADQDEPPPKGLSKDNLPQGEGVVYLFETDRDAPEGLRVVSPNADRSDGQVPSSLFRPPPFGQLNATRVALNERWLVVGLGGEDGGLDPLEQPDAAQADNSAENAGAVFVYDRETLALGDTTPLQYLKAPNIDANDTFGLTIALSGSTLVVGAPGEDSSREDDPDDNQAPDSGAAYVYEAGPAGFELSQYLKTPAPIRGADFFGSAVAIDRDLLVIGAAGDVSKATEVDGDRNNAAVFAVGAAYVFRRHDGRWRSEGYLKPSTATLGGFYGTSAALSGDRVAIGAPQGADCKGRVRMVGGPGAVYVYAFKDRRWALDQCLDGEETSRMSFFGGNLSMVGDRLLIGAGWDDAAPNRDPQDMTMDFTGAAYLEERGSRGWELRSRIRAPMVGTNDVFGTAVALDETRAVISAPQRSQTRDGEPTVESSGAVYSFDIDPPAPERAADKP